MVSGSAVLLGIIDDLTTGTLMIPEGGTENSLPAKAVDWAETNSQEAIPPEAWTAIGAPSLLSLQVRHGRLEQYNRFQWCRGMTVQCLRRIGHVACPNGKSQTFDAFLNNYELELT